jgi:hypothetical protein
MILGVDLKNICLRLFTSQNSTPFWANGEWQMTHKFDEIIIEKISDWGIGEIEQQFFAKQFAPASFFLAKKFDEIDPW